MKLFTNSIVYSEFQFDKEADFEREVVNNSKLFFGNHSIYIDAKRKLDAKSLGNTIPDGFLFDLSDPDNPEFYIVEVELASHSFYNHIFPQITKFFGFYKNSKSQSDLVEKIFTIITSDSILRSQFKQYLGDREIYKYLKDTIELSQNILLVLDGEKKELPEIMDTYTDTWGKMVRLVLLKKYLAQGNTIYSMHPDFESIEFLGLDDSVEDEGTEQVDITEEYHLEAVTDIPRKIYFTIKNALLEFDPRVVFNVQKYYISIKAERNIAYFEIRRKKIVLVVKNDEQDTRQRIHNNKIKTLSASVQKFYNGPSCAIMLESGDHLDEVIDLLRSLIDK